MILILPSIELENHRSKYVIRGEPGTEQFYARLSEMPELLCKLFRLENVKSIHITDVDSFDNPDDNNIDNICLMTEATFLPFQALVNFRTAEDCIKILEYGVHRIVLSDFVLSNPEDTLNLMNEYSERRIAFQFPVRKDKVFFPHTGIESNIREYSAYLRQMGAKRVILSHDDNELFPSKDLLSVMKEFFSAWTYQYDAKNLNELQKLEHLSIFGMDSLIIGESFYATNYPCQKIWRIAESRLDAGRDELITD